MESNPGPLNVYKFGLRLAIAHGFGFFMDLFIYFYFFCCGFLPELLSSPISAAHSGLIVSRFSTHSTLKYVEKVML
jgi:hypothetical protein